MKKKIIKFVIQFLIILIMFAILWFMFKDSYKDILNQLKNVRVEFFLIAVLLGNAYYMIDAFIYKSFLKKENCDVNYLRCIAVAYMSVFFNVTTFGAGIKPAQVAYLHRKRVEPGKAFGILTVPYVFNKSTIVLYALVMLAINNAFVLENFSDTFGYIYAGVGVSIVIIAVLILLCASKWFHGIICRIVDIILGRGKLAKYKFNEKIKTFIENMHDASHEIIKKPLIWIKYIGINVLRQSCWYFVPVIAIGAIGDSLGDITVSEALTVTALMQLLMGVIPASGGVGSLEVVFSLLFAAVFGKITAGSSMVIYRLATYYIPFIISMLIMLVLEFDLRKVPEPE